MFTRGSGILLHISSLPSIGGIGDFGPAAYEFVDFLRDAGQKYWQILPLNPTDLVYGNCPYSSPSAFAINPLFISPELLVSKGLLKKDEVGALVVSANADKVDYVLVVERKCKLLDQAFQRFKNTELEKGDFAAFCEKNNFWLDEYALFTVFKKRSDGKIWSDWPEDIRTRKGEIIKELRAKFPEEIKRIKFLQWTCFQQWELLREHCHRQKISLIGDIPIYVNEDSADVWSNPGVFKLGPDLKPVVVAGVPPDYFSKTGQRWGNPVFDWEKIKVGGYVWWMKRIDHNLKLFDITRIDHFRGFLGYWEIPASEPTAINGHWEKGPGDDFFMQLKKLYPDLPIIAEDLGVITPDVTETMNKFEFPGMKILHFAFNGDPQHPYLPENYSERCIAYTGTHDNNTSKGWYRKDLGNHEKGVLNTYFKKNINESNVAAELIHAALHSRAVIALMPMQDCLNLGEEARMNIPGTVLGNWEWRLLAGSLTKELANHLSQITRESQR